MLQRVLQSDVNMEWSQLEGPRGVGPVPGEFDLEISGEAVDDLFPHTSHGAGRFTYMDGWVSMVKVNVGEYTIHGCYG